MPQLSDWTQGIALEHLAGPADPMVREVTADSRRVRQGDLFVALRGSSGDGADFIEDAVARGAAAVVVDAGSPWSAPERAETAVFRTGEPRRVLARLARARFGAPDREMRMIAVTGTNGKTTVSWLGAQLLDFWGEKSGTLGTIRYRTGARDEAAGWTTPPAEHFYALLDEMRAAGQRACVFEASSHALDQDRIGACEVDVAAFTNLTREHLEYHRDLDDYLRAKLRLLECLHGGGRTKPPGQAVVNVEDPRLAAVDWPAGVVRVGTRADCRVKLLEASTSRDGIRMRLDFDGEVVDLESSLLGAYNVENLLLLAGVACAIGRKAADLPAAYAALHCVPGRLERVDLGEGAPLVLIDYAHTPDALQSVTRSLRSLSEGQLRIVFGCGGDRDRGKRPEMARAAVEGADAAFLTLDNPRTEDPQQIFDDARLGFVGHEERSWVIEDRAEALRRALSGCGSEDILLVAGKGHETYQILGHEKVDWDDRKVLSEAWQSLAEGGQR